MKRKTHYWLLCGVLLLAFIVPASAQYNLFVYVEGDPLPQEYMVRSLTYSASDNELEFHTDSGTESFNINNIRKVTFTGSSSSIHTNDTELPSAFQMFSPYPNPFNPSVSIPFTLPVAGEVHIRVVDLLGREVWSDHVQMNAGAHQVHLDANQWSTGMASSGMYMMLLEWNGLRQSARIMLVK